MQQQRCYVKAPLRIKYKRSMQLSMQLKLAFLYVTSVLRRLFLSQRKAVIFR